MSGYTVEMVLQEIETDREAMEKSLAESETVPNYAKSHQPIRDVWFAGCWLTSKLREYECPEERITKIGFEHGQRSFHGNAYKIAAAMFNAFVEGTLQERPGSGLGEELVRNSMEIRGNTLVLKVGSSEAKARLEAEFERLKALPPEELEAERARIEAELLEGDREINDG